MKLLNAMQPYNLFGFEVQDYGKAKVVAIPVPYDSTATYRGGSKEGPHAIITASRALEFYNEETDSDINDVGIYTTEELASNFGSPDKMVDSISKEVGLVLEDKKMPLLLGGEHTVSLGAIKALAKKSNDFTVLHFDAHLDTRDEYLGSKYCHACVMARARELCKNCYSVGIRSVESKEAAKKYGNKVLYMKDMRSMEIRNIVRSILANTSNNLYITIDLDVLDPSEMPSVGTPEPGGLRFNELTQILKGVVESRKVLGLDVVELCPIPGMIAPDYLAARLIFNTLSYIFQK